MSKQLVESILDKDFVLAESHFNDILNNIMEKKLYEKKRMIAAQMDEVLGGMTRAEIEAKKKAGYKKASDVLQDPRDIKIKPLVATKKDKKKVSEAVEVKPDPEGRIRGGSAKKGTFRRNIRAARIKGARKIIQKGGELGGSIAAGAVGAGQEIKSRVSSAKQAYRAHKAAQAAQASRQGDSDLRKTFGVKDPGEKPISSREKFVNALKGRETDYRKEKIKDPNKKPGVAGFLGKVARGALQGAESGLHSMEE